MDGELEGTYLADEQRLDVVESYLSHEASKRGGRMYCEPLDLVRQRTSPRHVDLLVAVRHALEGEQAVEDILHTLNRRERWALFHVVSCGCLDKELENVVGHPERLWRREAIRACDLHLDTRVGPLRYADGEGALPFPAAVELLRRLGGREAKPHRRLDSLIGRKDDDEPVRIHDGNGRLVTLAYAVRDNQLPDTTEVDVWVGYRKDVPAADLRVYDWAQRSVFFIPYRGVAFR
jgi:hypothetical protein